MGNGVIVAHKRQSFGVVCGYFAAEAEVPADWKATQERLDITDMMTANHWSKEEALRQMNSHWQPRRTSSQK